MDWVVKRSRDALVFSEVSIEICASAFRKKMRCSEQMSIEHLLAIVSIPGELKQLC